MAEKNKTRGGQDSINRGGRRGSQDESIGNQQGTAQTGAQNAGGRRVHDREDTFDEDLRRSGNRKSRGEAGSR